MKDYIGAGAGVKQTFGAKKMAGSGTERNVVDTHDIELLQNFYKYMRASVRTKYDAIHSSSFTAPHGLLNAPDLALGFYCSTVIVLNDLTDRLTTSSSSLPPPLLYIQSQGKTAEQTQALADELIATVQARQEADALFAKLPAVVATVAADFEAEDGTSAAPCMHGLLSL